MRISVIGTGYVGLVAGVCLADRGHDVVCVDLDPEKVDMINRGEAPIYEKGLSELLQRNAGKGLTASLDLRIAVLESDISLVSVDTPFDGERIGFQSIRRASEQIGKVLKEKAGYHVVVVRSTVVPGTTETVVGPILEEHSGKKAGRDFGLGMTPEFLREGEAVGDFMKPDRIVIGGVDERTISTVKTMYGSFEGTDFLLTTCKTAEMTKYVSNSMLATLISFSNEMANLCDAIGDVDIVSVMQGVHLDKRLNPILANGERAAPQILSYLAAGCGFGGSCFPKDVKALVSHGKSLGASTPMLESVIAINAAQPHRVVALLKKHFPNLSGVKVAVLGLAFKPDTDDVRESPALTVLPALAKENATISAYDPIAGDAMRAALTTNGILYCDTLDAAINDAEAIILLTSWPEFKALAERLSALSIKPLVVDGRRILNGYDFAAYEGIGLSREPSAAALARQPADSNALA